jgi:hypothetical protein
MKGYRCFIDSCLCFVYHEIGCIDGGLFCGEVWKEESKCVSGECGANPLISDDLRVLQPEQQ